MHLANLLKRVYPNERVQEEIEDLRISFNFALIKSKDPKLKHDGMEMLSKLLNNLSENTKVSPEKIYQCINHSKALHIIISPHNHDEKFMRF